MKTIKIVTAMILIGGLFAFMGCEEDDPGKLTIQSMNATGTDLETGQEVTKDLNAATAPSDVPLDAVMSVTFSKEVDPQTLGSAAVTLSSAKGEVQLDVNTSGQEVTITPQSELERGTQYTISLAATIQADDGGAFEGAERSFTTAGQGIVVPPQSDSQVAYFTFNNTTEDYTGNHTVSKADISGYVQDRFGYVNSAAEFDGVDDIIDVTNTGDLINPSTTISFWFWTDLDDEKVTNGMFLMGATAEYGFFFEMGIGDGNPWFKVTTRHKQHPDATNDFGSATAWGDAIRGNGEGFDVWSGDLAAMLDENWNHFVLSYDQSTSMKRAYLNGNLVWENDLSASDEWKMKEMHIDTASATNETMDVGIGFAGSSDNHSTGWADYETYVTDGVAKTFFGYMDDVRFFNTALSNTEVQSLYNSEKPAEE